MSDRGAWVRLTAPAVDDLHALMRRDPQIVRWCLKKMLLLERNPRAGEPLLGGLIGFRKLTVSDRHWRIVWRDATDEVGGHVIEVAEVWAAGARADAEVYAEMNRRLAALGDSPQTRPLQHVIEALGRIAGGLGARAEPSPAEPAPPGPVPGWVANALVGAVGLDPDDVAAMTPDEAMARLQQHWSTPPGR